MKLLEFVLSKKWIRIHLFAVCCGFILWMTLIREPHSHRIFRIDLFWALRGWINGEPWGNQELVYYLENFLLFIPFGLFFPEQKNWKWVVISASITSVVIELTQYVFILGECELDDVISNTIGALIGFLLFVFAEKIYRKFRGESRV